jgi:hypothetical protein
MRTRPTCARPQPSFVGRGDEMETLKQALERTVEKRPVIDLVADAGLGKEPVSYEFVEKCGPGDDRQQAHGVAHGKAVPTPSSRCSRCFGV